MRGGDRAGRHDVVPGDPCASIVLQKVSARRRSARACRRRAAVPEPREQPLLSDWIAEGAHDN